MEWRRAGPEDAEAIGHLSLQILGDLGEPAEIFAERISLCPEGCHVLMSGQDMLGHAIAHPWLRGEPPAMNQMLGSLPPDADCWYIHEVALVEQARGRGGVRAILQVLTETAAAAGIHVMALVAVEGASAYWEGLGFRQAPLKEAQIGSYGGQAAYMELNLQARRQISRL